MVQEAATLQQYNSDRYPHAGAAIRHCPLAARRRRARFALDKRHLAHRVPPETGRPGHQTFYEHCSAARLVPRLNAGIGQILRSGHSCLFGGREQMSTAAKPTSPRHSRTARHGGPCPRSRGPTNRLSARGAPRGNWSHLSPVANGDLRFPHFKVSVHSVAYAKRAQKFDSKCSLVVCQKGIVGAVPQRETTPTS